jgi:hypothetical protein
MVLKGTSRLGSLVDDKLGASTGSLEEELQHQYERKQQQQQQVRPGLEGANERGGSQRIDGLIESYLASNSSERRSTSVRDLRHIFDADHVGPSSNDEDAYGSPASLRPCLSRSKLRNKNSPTTESEQGVDSVTSPTASSTFNLAPSNSISPEVAALRKRLAEFRHKLRNQEALHIQERLTWKGQTVELQRLRRERDRLLEDQASRGEQLQGTRDIAEAIMVENKHLRAECSHALQPEVSNLDRGGVDWEMEFVVRLHQVERDVRLQSSNKDFKVDWEMALFELRQGSSEKDQKIGVLAAQLEEKRDQLQQETEVNTEFVVQLHQAELDLRLQSSDKDLKINILAAELDERTQQLQQETDLNTEIVAGLRAAESDLREVNSLKDLAIGHLVEGLNESRGLLQMHYSQNDLGSQQMESRPKNLTVEKLMAEMNESRGSLHMEDLTVEELMAEMNESRGSLHTEDLMSGVGGDDRPTTTSNCSRAMDPKWIEKFQEAQDQLKKELSMAKMNTLKTMTAVRTKLVEERTKLKRGRKMLQGLRQTVVKESVQARAVISGLRCLIERMQEKITTLNQENKSLKATTSH